MRALLHHQPGGKNRITQMTNARHRTGFQGVTIHHTGVQFMGFITRKDSANSGVKQWTLFQQTHRFRHHIQRTFARFQHFLPGFNNGRQRLDVA